MSSSISRSFCLLKRKTSKLDRSVFVLKILLVKQTKSKQMTSNIGLEIIHCLVSVRPSFQFPIPTFKNSQDVNFTNDTDQM